MSKSQNVFLFLPYLQNKYEINVDQPFPFCYIPSLRTVILHNCFEHRVKMKIPYDDIGLQFKARLF